MHPGILCPVPKLEISRRVNAPTERVWAVLTDLDTAAERISGIESVERLAGPEFGVGTRWRETRVMFGKEATEEMEVGSLVPGRSYTVDAASHGAEYHSELSVEGVGDGTSLLAMSFEAIPQTFGAKLASVTIGLLFRGATKKALIKDLDDIATAAEAPGEPEATTPG